MTSTAVRKTVMPMLKLVIAEKPSVAVSIANVIGADRKYKGYREGNGYIVSWCIGHLAELSLPEAYDEKYSKWKTEDLPIVPKAWKYSVDVRKKEQFKILKTLMNRSDVSEVINACDAGREGERIFRTVYEFSGCKKPVKRLWISSLEDEAIKEGFRSLKPGEDYNNLYMAAECRAKADWLIGMNFSRLFSVKYRQRFSVGRVLSPTLSFITERQDEIQGFKPESFFTAELKNENGVIVSDKLKTKEEAQAAKDKCLSEPPVFVSSVSEEHREKAPLLYDLTSLQRDANRVYGFTAQQTLDYLQSLYERKLCTYPRTDSRFLTDDMKSTAEKLINVCKSFFNGKAKVKDVSVLCDSRKVSDHHAVIPTLNLEGYDLSSLANGERKLLLLIIRRMIEATCEEYISETVTYTFSCGDYLFTAKETTVKQIGWKVFSKQDKEENKGSLSGMKPGDTFSVAEGSVKEGKTKPKPQFTEDTLLSAMEQAGKEDMPDDAERQGIGTPATRAEIIEKLIKNGYVKRDGKKLVPNETGVSLVSVLHESLKSAALTAEWEQKLKQVENGKFSPDVFMNEIMQYVSDVIEKVKQEKTV